MVDLHLVVEAACHHEVSQVVMVQRQVQGTVRKEESRCLETLNSSSNKATVNGAIMAACHPWVGCLVVQVQAAWPHCMALQAHMAS